MARGNIIGHQGKIPWHLPKDFKWFKEKTLGHALVMGRKTYESIGRPLPGRMSIVVTRQKIDLPGCQVIHDLGQVDALELAGRTVFIIGGGEIYRAALPRCTDLWISHVEGDYPGDTRFPDFADAFEAVATVRTEVGFSVVHYRRLSSPVSSS